MTAAEWSRVQEIAGAALDLSPGEREAYLDKSCAGDLGMRQRVSALIEASSEAEAFFDEAFGGLAQELLADGVITSEPAGPKTQAVAPLVGAGQRIGRYVIDGVLGGGGMGEAFSARDTELDRAVALKFVRRAIFDGSSSESEASAERQVREAKAASALNHPYIVTVYEVLRTDFGVAIVMELVKGEGLRTLCNQKQPLHKVLRIGEQMAEALAAAAAAGIVHSDIKPENVVLRADGFIKILDFGLAQRIDAATVSHPGLPAGSYRYMSPEQTRGEKLTGASDVFSLGTVLFELISGTHPFPGETALQAMMAIGGGKPKVLAEVDATAPKELSDLLGRMMAKDPAKRPSAHDVAERLNALRGEASQPPGGPIVAASRRSWRRPSVAAAAIIAVMALASGLVWRFHSQTKGAGGEQGQISEAIPFARGAKQASIASDGSAVAYTCSDAGLRQVCVTPLSGGKGERFGKSSYDNENPLWSPDGKTLAYLSATGVEQAEVILRNRADGAERTVMTIGSPGGAYGSVMCWGPRMNHLIVSTNLTAQDSFGLFLLSTETGELRRLTTPPPMGRPFGDRGPTVSPDGRWLAFTRAQAEGLSDLYVVELDGNSMPRGEPRKLETGRSWNVTPVWTADGKELIFSTGTLRQHRLARIAAFERRPPSPIALSMVGSVSSPAIGKDAAGKRILLFTSSLNITNLWEVALARGGGSGRQLTTPASSRDFQPNYARDGRRFAFVSDRSGYEEVWVADASGANPTQWTQMECGKVAVPHWSPDSTRITFSAVCGGEGSIYVTGGPGEKPVRLTEAGSLNENSRWSPDSHWIYFTSFRTGVSTTWRVPDGGGQAVPFSSRMTSNPQVSWDGKNLYFTRLTGAKLGLWRTPTDRPADEELVLDEVGDYVVGRFGIYFIVVDDPGRVAIRFLDFTSGKSSTVAALPKPQYIFDVSADGTKLIYARNHLDTEDLFRVDGFR